MERITAVFDISELPEFRTKLGYFGAGYNTFALLDSCGDTAYGKATFDYLLAAGVVYDYLPDQGEALTGWKQFIQQNKDWIFGFLAYELNAETDAIRPPEATLMDVSSMHFFVPQILVKVIGQQAEISVHANASESGAGEIFEAICSTEIKRGLEKDIALSSLISAESYLHNVEMIRRHIYAGNIYELNYCQPFIAENVAVEPVTLFDEMCRISPAPFSVLFRREETYLISASPERFFQFDGTYIRSMPIKGTARRGNTPGEDLESREALKGSIKDQAENVMIVDLVRNDLTRYAVPGTVQVESLMEVKTFPQVHHLVSSVRAALRKDAHVCDAIANAFPMGSMTGAPKIRAMQIAAEMESYQRGLYSGAFGYFTPEGNCDFNVIIRSLIYDRQIGRLVAWAGGAIVYDSIPERELEECHLKLAGIRKALLRSA